MKNADKLDDIFEINKLLVKRFGESSAFMIITRLAEEVGELAEQVNHLETVGVKAKKLGTPNKINLAKEAQDVIRVVLQLVSKYNVEKEFSESIEQSLKELKRKFTAI